MFYESYLFSPFVVYKFRQVSLLGCTLSTILSYLAFFSRSSVQYFLASASTLEFENLANAICNTSK